MYSIFYQSWSSSFELPNLLLSFPIVRIACVSLAYALILFPIDLVRQESHSRARGAGNVELSVFSFFSCARPVLGLCRLFLFGNGSLQASGTTFSTGSTGLCWRCKEVLLWFRGHRPLTEEALKRNGYDVNERKLYNVFTESWVKVVASYAAGKEQNLPNDVSK